MKRPLIGITASLWVPAPDKLEKEAFRFDRLNRAYHRRVEEAGGLPVILPVLAEAATTRELVVRLDGLLFSGGDDVHPSFYGEGPLHPTTLAQPERDEAELSYFRAARDLKRPIFGICRGLQILNVALGGTLYQDTSQSPFAPVHRATAEGQTAMHPVSITPGSRLARLAGGLETTVNSSHHQHLKALAPGLLVSAVSPDGGTEALESADGDAVLAVQWHPERLPEAALSRALFADFISRAGRNLC